MCFRIAAAGLVVYYCPYSIIHHIENATTADQFKADRLKKLVDVNRTKFMERWRAALQRRDFDCRLEAKAPAKASSTRLHAVADSRPVAVVFTPGRLMPGSGARYMLAMARAMSATHRVVLTAPERFSSYRLAHLGDKLGIDVSGLAMMPFEDVRAEADCDVFVAIGDSVHPSVPAVGRRNIYVCRRAVGGTSRDAARNLDNIGTYQRLVVATLEAREAYFRTANSFRHDTDATFIAPSIGMDGASDDATGKWRESPIGQGTSIVSVGNFIAGEHSKRQDVLIEALRRLIDSGVAAELHFVGSLWWNGPDQEHYQDLLRRADGLPVQFHVDAPRDVLLGLLRRSPICWHAAGLGVDREKRPELAQHAGTGVLEAMSHGRIAFAVPCGGPARFIQDGVSGFHYDTIDALLDKTTAVLRDGQLALSVGRNAVAAATLHSDEMFDARWMQLVAGIDV